MRIQGVLTTSITVSTVDYPLTIDSSTGTAQHAISVNISEMFFLKKNISNTYVNISNTYVNISEIFKYI